MVAARAQVSMELQIPVIFETASDSHAQEVEASWNRLLAYLAKQMLSNASAPEELASPTGKAMQTYVQRIVTEIPRVLKPNSKRRSPHGAN